MQLFGGTYCFAINSPQFIVFLFLIALSFLNPIKNNVLWPLCLLSKSYKSHSKTFENEHSLAVAFFAFWAISFFNTIGWNPSWNLSRILYLNTFKSAQAGIYTMIMNTKGGIFNPTYQTKHYSCFITDVRNIWHLYLLLFSSFYRISN